MTYKPDLDSIVLRRGTSLTPMVLLSSTVWVARWPKRLQNTIYVLRCTYLWLYSVIVTDVPAVSSVHPILFAYARIQSADCRRWYTVSYGCFVSAVSRPVDTSSWSKSFKWLSSSVVSLAQMCGSPWHSFSFSGAGILANSWTNLL